MLDANDILMPHTPEVLAQKIQKKIVEVEVIFPGLVDKANTWVLSKDFKALFKEVHKPKAKDFKSLTSPASMRVVISKLAGITSYWQPYPGNALVDWLADYIWVREGNDKKYWEHGLYVRAVL